MANVWSLIGYKMRLARRVLEREAVCLRSEGRSQYYSLLLRREWPAFVGNTSCDGLYAATN